MKQFNRLLSVVVSTEERFVGALRVGDRTPRYLNNLSKQLLIVCESGRIKMCVGDITN
jgi:hypothetical protein